MSRNPLSPQEPRRTHLALRVVLILTVTWLLFINLGGWILYHAVHSLMDAGLSERLIAAGELIAWNAEDAGLPDALLPLGERWPDVLAASTADPIPATAESLLSALAWLDGTLRESVGILDMRRGVILDPEGRVLLDSEDTVSIGSEDPFVFVDLAEFGGALRGNAVCTAAYPVEGTYFKRAYVPVFGASDVAAVVSVEEGYRAFLALRRLQRRLALSGAVSIVLGGILIAMVYRVIRRTMALEAASERAARALEMERMTSSVAHEIRNPLGILRTTAETLRECGESPETRDLAEEIIEEADRLGAIVRRFSILSGSGEARGGGEGPEDVDPSALIRECLERYGTAHPDVPIQLEQEGEMPPGTRIRMPAENLESVLRNLLDNARESGSSPGIRVSLILSNGWVEVRVRDWGEGMASEEARQAVQPYYTTKPTGSGIGLPLSIRMLEMAGGSLDIESRKGRGTCVTIRIPRIL